LALDEPAFEQVDHGVARPDKRVLPQLDDR
jgi:hypothetical protein